jgi:hypothetical protein
MTSRMTGGRLYIDGQFHGGRPTLRRSPAPIPPPPRPVPIWDATAFGGIVGLYRQAHKTPAVGGRAFHQSRNPHHPVGVITAAEIAWIKLPMRRIPASGQPRLRSPPCEGEMPSRTKGIAMPCTKGRRRVTALATLTGLIGLGSIGCESEPRPAVVRETVVSQAPPTTAPSAAGSTTIIRQYDVVAEPPPPVVEVVPPPPPVGVWIGGYWRPEPHWVWVHGRWRR